MLSQPLMLKEGDVRGRSLPSVAPPPHLSLADEVSHAAHRLEVRRLLRGAVSSLSRRLDSLERSIRRRRRRRRRRRGAAAPDGPSHNSALIAPVTSSSSSSSSSCSSMSDGLVSGQGGRGGVSSRRMQGGEGGEGGEEEEEEEERSITQPAHRRRWGGGAGRSEDTCPPGGNVSVYTAPPLPCRSDSQHAMQLQCWGERQADSQSEALALSIGQWHFCEQSPPLSFFSNHSAAHMWLCRGGAFSPAPLLRLSAVTVDTVLEAVRGGACGSPPRPLRDWTAPPSLAADHCYVRMVKLSSTFSARRQQRRRANHGACTVQLLGGRALSVCLANGLRAPAAAVQSAASSPFPSTNGEQRKRVSQIRIRRASPRETLLTPMGLPKVKRLKKKEFSLEEIYTNKNYKSPSNNRSLETIFEEPREKDGSLLLIGQQKRRRLLLFPDFTQPRKRKRLQGAGPAVAMAPRKRAAARRHVHGSEDDCDLDVMLVERLSALEDFLSRQGLDT